MIEELDDLANKLMQQLNSLEAQIYINEGLYIKSTEKTGGKILR